MSDNLWVSEIDARLSDVIGAFKAFGTDRDIGVEVIQPGQPPPPFNRDFIVFWLNELDEKCLVTAWRHGYLPGVFLNLSAKLHTTVVTAHENNQVGFTHYSKFDNGQTVDAITFFEDFVEHENRSWDELVSVSGATTDTSDRSDSAQAIFDHFTSNFDYFSLHDFLMGDDGEFEDCTTIIVKNDKLNALQTGVYYDGKLLPWKQLTALGS